MKLAKDFGASQYASAREFARTNHRCCVIYILEKPEYTPGDGYQAAVRRIEPSRSFREKFGLPTDTVITPDHFLGRVIPVGRRMTRPMTVTMKDRNGTEHECVAEAFDTKHNILILLYPTAALTKSIFILPDGAAS